MIENLKFLTEATLKEVCTLDIITPSIYRDQFISIAEKHNIDYDESGEYHRHLIKLINDYNNNIVETTSTIKSNIQTAITAVREKDEEKLKEVENNLIKLELYIKSLEDEIFHDQLTKTYNRRWLYEKFLKEEKFQSNGTLSFIDINEFKKINDTFGHVAGDKVLILLANLFKEIKNSEIVRFAGDEFIIFTADSQNEYGKFAVKAIAKKLSEKVVSMGDKQFTISFSSGSVRFRIGDSFNELLGKADELMYEDKRSN